MCGYARVEHRYFNTGVQEHMTRHARWPRALRLLIALASLALGLLLLLAGLTVQQIAAVTGIGVAITGVALVLRGFGRDSDSEDRGDVAAHPTAAVGAPVAERWVTRLSGCALVVVGALMALWPDAGAPWLAAGIALALILHGIVSGVEAVRGSVDQRVSRVLIALAGIALGVLSFSWPVLTLAIFRLAVAAWLLFIGAHALLELWRSRWARAQRHVGPTTPGPTAKLARWSRTIASAVALLLAVGAVYGSAQLLGGTPGPVPDAFYDAPDQVPSQRGQLIRTEPLTVGVPAGARAWKMLYTTTRSDGSAAISSGTILAPADHDDSPLPLLTISHGTTGIVSSCAPLAQRRSVRGRRGHRDARDGDEARLGRRHLGLQRDGYRGHG